MSDHPMRFIDREHAKAAAIDILNGMFFVCPKCALSVQASTENLKSVRSLIDGEIREYVFDAHGHATITVAIELRSLASAIKNVARRAPRTT